MSEKSTDTDAELREKLLEAEKRCKHIGELFAGEHAAYGRLFVSFNYQRDAINNMVIRLEELLIRLEELRKELKAERELRFKVAELLIPGCVKHDPLKSAL